MVRELAKGSGERITRERACRRLLKGKLFRVFISVRYFGGFLKTSTVNLIIYHQKSSFRQYKRAGHLEECFSEKDPTFWNLLHSSA
jgi:hypothetical protein